MNQKQKKKKKANSRVAASNEIIHPLFRVSMF